MAIRLRRLTRIIQGNFSLNYLGYLVFYCRGKHVYFEEIIRKIARRILSWHNKFLSHGRRQVLISYVLQSMSVYLLTVMHPLKRVIDKIHQLFARFIWTGAGGIKGKHWVAGKDLCYPREVGGIGFRSLHDVNKFFYC